MIQNKSPPNNRLASDENYPECHGTKGPWTLLCPFIPKHEAEVLSSKTLNCWRGLQALQWPLWLRTNSRAPNAQDPGPDRNPDPGSRLQTTRFPKYFAKQRCFKLGELYRKKDSFSLFLSVSFYNQ